MKIEVKILDDAEAMAKADSKSAEELFAEKLIMGRFL